MKKIKKFKINIRPSYFLRLLKDSIDIDKAEIAGHIKDGYELVSPCTIYDSFKLEDIKDEGFRKMAEGWAPDIKVNPYSVFSMIIVTVGKKLEEEVSKVKNEGNERHVKILDALGAEALEQSYNFVNKLILKDAEKEECTVSALSEIPEAGLEAAVKLVDAHKIGVVFDAKRGLIPSGSLAVYGYWIPVKKKKRK